jgi:hypothetical protein
VGGPGLAFETWVFRAIWFYRKTQIKETAGPSTKESWRLLLGSVFRQSHGPLGKPKVMKNGSRSVTTLSESTALPFVISTEAQRSGEICGSAALPWKCFSTEESWAFGPPKVMKNGSCSATTVDGGTALPFVISTEAQRSGEICGSAAPPWKCFSTERGVVEGPAVSFPGTWATHSHAKTTKQRRSAWQALEGVGWLSR